MTFHKSLRIGRVRIYITTCRMKRVMKRDERDRFLRKTMQKLKHQRYRRIGGVCECCGLSFDEYDLEIHHVIPVSQNPCLASSPSNIQLLCRPCHYRIHNPGKPLPEATRTRSAGTVSRGATS